MVIQSAPKKLGSPNRATSRRPRMIKNRTIVPRSTAATAPQRPRADSLPSGVFATPTGLGRLRLRHRHGAVTRHPEQREDREHERRRGAVTGDRLVGSEDRLREPDGEPAEQGHPERLEPPDESGGE